jgi:thioredoxin-related protein
LIVIVRLSAILFESIAGPKRDFMKAQYAFIIMFLTVATDAAANALNGFVYEYEEEKPEVSPIPELKDFEQVASAVRAKGVPMLVEFSTPWCRYCKALEEQVLKPLMLNGKYKDRIIIKKLEVNTYSSVTGFDGKQYSTDQISMMYGVDLYPTLVFFDASGREVSQRIVGITVLEYVAEALEKAIDKAIQATVSTL